MRASVYVINLDRRSDRLVAVSNQLMRLGIAFERIQAIDAKELFSGKEHIELKSPLHLIAQGAVACKMSHIKALQTFLRSDSEFALILEDDVRLANDLPALLECADWFPHPHKIVNLEVNIEDEYLLGRELGRTPTGRELRAMYRFQYGGGAAAYLICRDGAAIVCAEKGKFELQIDHTLFDMSYSKISRRLMPVQVTPAMAKQKRSDSPDGFSSDMMGGKESKKTWKRNQKTLWNKFRRIPFRFKLLWLRMQSKAQKIHVSYADSHKAI